MIVSEIADSDLLARLGQSTAPRTSGLHLSDIYKVLMRRLQPKRFTGQAFDPRRVEIGLLFENMLERALEEKFATVRPGEIVSDEGVIMSPDGVNPALCAGEEYKTTSMSCADGIFERVEVDGVTHQIPRDKFLHYFIQMKGYAKWLEVRTFILTVLFIYGDYRWHVMENCHTYGPCAQDTYCGTTHPKKDLKFRCGPVFKQYRVEFSDQEIDDNWNMLMRVAAEEGMLPPV